MKTLKGPGIFLAQYAADEAPFNSLDTIAEWAASLGFVAVQLPTWDKRIIDIAKAAESKMYCDDLRAMLQKHGLQVSELSSHLQGQLVAVHPAYDKLFPAFGPSLLTTSAERRAWAEDQLRLCAKASQNLGLTAHPTFSGALAWPYFYPWPQRSAGLIDEAFNELTRRWLPILQYFDDSGVDLCFELHPGEDLHDGTTFDRFLTDVGGHPRACILYDPSNFVLQQMNYVAFLDIYHSRIKAFHVKDAEHRANGRSGVYGGYQGWIDRPGRFRSLGDGQVDFKSIFSKLAQYDFPGWAILEWEYCLKNGVDGAGEGAKFITDHIIQVADHAFDDFAKGSVDLGLNRTILDL